MTVVRKDASWAAMSVAMTVDRRAAMKADERAATKAVSTVSD